jgi:hypothetical protein
MNAPTSVFALGRMRHLDLLALYFQVTGPVGHGSEPVDKIGQAGPGYLVEAILQARPPA